eukprot:7210070-Alexandrium_andersonii.AAC.1
MSASLVGSEMCIRDSASGVAGGARALRSSLRASYQGGRTEREQQARGSCLLYTSDAADDM